MFSLVLQFLDMVHQDLKVGPLKLLMWTSEDAPGTCFKLTLIPSSMDRFYTVSYISNYNEHRLLMFSVYVACLSISDIWISHL